MLAASSMAGLVTSFTFDSLNFATFATTLFLLLGATGALWRLRDSDPVAERDARYAQVVKSTDEAWPGLLRHLQPRSGRPPPVRPQVAESRVAEAPAAEPRAADAPATGPPPAALVAAEALATGPPPAALVAAEAPVAEPTAPGEATGSSAPISTATASATDRGNRSFRTALGWSTVMNVGRQVATLAITFVLAALLGPRDFGVVAMATVYVAFVQLLVQQGMGAAIIHRPNLSDDHLHTAFWMLGGASVGVAVLSAAGSGLWASLNDLPELQGVILALTPLVVISGLLIIPDALLRRGMNFRPLAVRTNVSVAVGGVIGIWAALSGWGVWALVAQQLSTALLELVILWAAVSWRPRARWSPQAARELLSFTIPSSVATIGVFANSRADAFITGLLLGPTAVGLFRFASRLVETVVQAVMGSIRAVSLPELARYQRDPDGLARRVLDLTHLTSAAALIPLAALAAAGPAVIALAGDDWSPAVPALGLLAVAGAGRTISSLAGPTLQAIGRPGLLAVLTWVGAALTVGALVLSGLAVQNADAATQVRTLALATAIVYGGLLLAIGLWSLVACTEVTMRGLAASIVTPAAAAGVGYLVGVIIDAGIVHDLAPLVRAAVVGAAACGAAVVTLAILDPPVRGLLRHVGARAGLLTSDRST
jgi:O-antigen/teichoic acid export membrane protein